MSAAKPEFSAFITSLKGRRISIVFSDRFTGSRTRTWYHRWRSSIIGLYSEAAEALGMEPAFYNVDQFVEACAHRDTERLGSVLNLNAGNRFLDNLVVVPALSRWRELPVGFCDARTAMLSEDKRLAKRIARDCGWRVAEDVDTCSSGTKIIKPSHFGSSVGVVKTDDTCDALPSSDYLCEAFVAGYDATIVAFYDCSRERLAVAGAQIVVPSQCNPTEWIYSEAAKEADREATTHSFRFRDVGPELCDLTLALCEQIGSRSVARVDVRFDGDPEAEHPMEAATCTFIEYNAMPTLGRVNSVNQFAERFVAESGHAACDAIRDLTHDKSLQAACYLLASTLYVATD